MPNWDDHRFFLAIARESSIRKAAHTLGVSHSTVLRRITAFEQDLGVRLFERLPTGYFTTPAGEDMLHSAKRIEEEALAAARRIAGRDTQLRGKVRVSIPGVLATHLLMPDLAAFDKAHPEIDLDLALTYAITDLAKREADVAIRLSNDPPDDLVGRRVLHMSNAAYVTREGLPKINGMDAAEQTKWIGFSSETASTQWLDESDFPNKQVGVRIGDPLARLEAARAGIGMAMLPCFLGDTEPGLYRMPPGTLQRHKDVWVLTHKDLRDTARIRKFTAYIAHALQRHRDLLEGQQPRDLPSVAARAA